MIALLAVPLTVVFSVCRIDGIEGSVRFHWLFGLVRFHIRIPQGGKVELRQKSRVKNKPKYRKQTRKVSTGGIATLLKQAGFRLHIYKLVRSMLSAIDGQNLFLLLRIGLGDPADTGRLWAIIGPMSGMLQNLHSIELHIEPEFSDPIFEVQSHGKFRLVPIHIIALMIVFMLSPVTLRAWHTLRQGNG
jgi:hypothetical protein